MSLNSNLIKGLKIPKNRHMKLKKSYKEVIQKKSIYQIFYKSMIFLKNLFLDYFSLHPECILKVEIYKNSIAACDMIRDNVEKLEKEGYKVQLVLWLSETVFLNSSLEADLALNQLIDQLILQIE